MLVHIFIYNLKQSIFYMLMYYIDIYTTNNDIYIWTNWIVSLRLPPICTENRKLPSFFLFQADKSVRETNQTRQLQRLGDGMG